MKKILLCSALLFSHTTTAGNTAGTIGRLYVHNHNTNVLFRMNSDDLNFSSCATTQRYVIDTSTEQGKNSYSAILAAKTTNQTVFIQGTEQCDISGTAETMQLLYIE